MKELFKLRTILCWIISIGAFWFSALMFPYNFYYNEVYLPEMSFSYILMLFGITATLGTVFHFLMFFVKLIGKYIGMKKNLLFFFLYYQVLGTAYAFGTDYLLDCIKIEPFGIYLLIGFLPAMLCSIIYSYHVSHKKLHEAKKQ